jgi:hypothetical protein
MLVAAAGVRASPVASAFLGASGPDVALFLAPLLVDSAVKATCRTLR